MKRLAVLGSTGSIGTSTLEVIRAHPDRFRAYALAAGRNIDLLRRQILEHRPALVAVSDADDAKRLASEFSAVEVIAGPVGLERAACHADVDMVVAALVGAVGLPSTMASLRAGKDIALANKEVLVIAGELVVREAERTGSRLLPVDSEHCALHQALRVGPAEAVSRLILTASGGPFRTWTTSRMERATVEEALAHPTWRMGPKISVDSATMANKGLEIIEAHHLFAMPEERIDIVIHPQSLVHSMVAYIDGSIIAQLATNDMRIPILYALGWPDRLASDAETLDLDRVGGLDFSPPDSARFPALALARAALRTGGEMPAVFNAANEAAVEAFLGGRCSFGRIAATIDAVMNRWCNRNHPLVDIDQAIEVDTEARRITVERLGNTTPPSGVSSS